MGPHQEKPWRLRGELGDDRCMLESSGTRTKYETCWNTLIGLQLRVRVEFRVPLEFLDDSGL